VQMVAAYGAIANGGVLVKPRLVLDGEPQEGRRVIPTTTAARAGALLWRR